MKEGLRALHTDCRRGGLRGNMSRDTVLDQIASERQGKGYIPKVVGGALQGHILCQIFFIFQY